MIAGQYFRRTRPIGFDNPVALVPSGRERSGNG